MIEFDDLIDITYPGVTVKPEAWEDPDIFPIFSPEPFVSSGDERYSNTLGEGDGGVVIHNRPHKIDPQNLDKRTSAMIDLLYNCKVIYLQKSKEQTVELCKKCMRVQRGDLAQILRTALYIVRDRENDESKNIPDMIKTIPEEERIKVFFKEISIKFSYNELEKILKDAYQR